MKKKKDENLYILKDPVLVKKEDDGIIISEEDSIKVSNCSDNSVIVYGPKISGPYGNKIKYEE